jgi:hypothetical protein
MRSELVVLELKMCDSLMKWSLHFSGAPKRLSPPFVGKLNATHLLIDWEHRDNVTYTFFFLVGQRKPKILKDLTANETVIRRREDLTEV